MSLHYLSILPRRVISILSNQTMNEEADGPIDEPLQSGPIHSNARIVSLHPHRTSNLLLLVIDPILRYLLKSEKLVGERRDRRGKGELRKGRSGEAESEFCVPSGSDQSRSHIAPSCGTSCFRSIRRIYIDRIEMSK